jgi:hypothetical protein
MGGRPKNLDRLSLHSAFGQVIRNLNGTEASLLRTLRLANVWNEPGVGSSALSKVLPCLVEAQLPVHGQADFRGILVFLAVVLPSAHRAQRQRIRGLERPVSAAWASIAGGLVLHHQDGRTLGAAGYGPGRSQA